MSATQEFTDDQLATLRRIEKAPFAPEARYRDMNPLVPTGEIRPAHEVVPHPDLTTGTAAEWSSYYLAQAYAEHGLGLHLMHQLGDMRTADVGELQEMGNAYVRFADYFALGFLMRHVSDEVARDLGSILDFGDTLDEWTVQWLTEAGIDPQRIRSSATREEDRAEGERRRAERAAQATS
jgi:hypothetical protein